MEQARQVLLSLLPEGQAEQHYQDMVRLRVFLDQGGGVRACVGPEYDAEAVIYLYAKQVQDGALSTGQAVEALGQRLPGCGEDMRRGWFRLFAALMAGTPYSRPAG